METVLSTMNRLWRLIFKPFKIDFDIKKLERMGHIPHWLVCSWCSNYFYGVSAREFKSNPQYWYNLMGGRKEKV